MYHTYLDNRYNKEKVVKMQAMDSGSETFHDFINADELELLQRMIKNIEFPEKGQTSKYAGASYSDPQGIILKNIFDEKIKKIIGDYELDFFAWQEAIKPWKIHADLRWYPEKLPYKVILVPLDVVSDQDSWKETHTIAFKQRDYLESNTNSDRGKKGNSDQSHWKRPADNPGTHNVVKGCSISKEQHKKYFSHMDYEFLEGLEIDNIYKWTPCSAVTWDQNQLHCADNFLANGITTKRSLIFFTNQQA